MANSNTTSSGSLSQTQIAIGLFVYIVTGVLQPMIIDALRINNLLGHKWLLIPTLANVAGMALCGFIATSAQWSTFKSLLWSSRRLRNMVLLTAAVDLISGMCLTFGILLTGGSIFVVLYNSVPAWTAILSRFILQRKLNAIQIAGVGLVCVGLVMNVLGTNLQLSHNDDKDVDDSVGEAAGRNAAHIVILGSMIVLAGSLMHSLMYVLSDLSMSPQDFAADPSTTDNEHDEEEKKKKGGPAATAVTGEIWSCCLGSLEVCFMTVWVFVGILNHGFFEDEDGMSSRSANPPIPKVISGFLGLVLIDAAHAAAFFTMLKNLGAVASALLKGLQAIVVIALSAVLYCPAEESQCLTWIKFISAVVVISGVMGYGFGSRKRENPAVITNNMFGSQSRLYESSNSLELSVSETEVLVYGST